MGGSVSVPVPGPRWVHCLNSGLSVLDHMRCITVSRMGFPECVSGEAGPFCESAISSVLTTDPTWLAEFHVGWHREVLLPAFQQRLALPVWVLLRLIFLEEQVSHCPVETLKGLPTLYKVVVVQHASPVVRDAVLEKRGLSVSLGLSDQAGNHSAPGLCALLSACSPLPGACWT